MRMDEVEFHREPPSNLPPLVVAFGGWIDAGEAATGAMRALVCQLGVPPLATIDPEECFDVTQVRPVVRLSAAGQRLIRWPRSAFWTWQPFEGRAGLLLFRGMEPQRRWRTYTTVFLDVAARCGVQRLVSLGGGPCRRAAYPAPTRYGPQHRPRLAGALRRLGAGASLAL
jgi:PAC2 family